MRLRQILKTSLTVQNFQFIGKIDSSSKNFSQKK